MRDKNHLNIGNTPAMKTKAFFKKLLGVIEILLEEEPKKKKSDEKLAALGREIDAIYDSSYYGGTMSYGEAEAWKEYWKHDRECSR